MKVKSKRKMAGILAAVLIALVLLAFDCINGDPISERWAMHRAIQFAEKLYPDQTFTAEGMGSMRGFCYTTRVQSQQSRDTRFYVKTSFWLFTSDTPTVDHTQYVDARLNTAWRMNAEARADLAPALVDALTEYDITCDEAPAFGCPARKAESAAFTGQAGGHDSNHIAAPAGRFAARPAKNKSRLRSKRLPFCHL